MRVQLPDTELRLAGRQMLGLADPAGVRITSRCGSLWVTQDHDPRDVVLSAGESMTFDKTAPVVVQALGSARVALAQQSSPEPPQPHAGWLQRLGAALGLLPAQPVAAR